MFALLAVVGAVFAFQRYHGAMDIYEKWILAGTVPVVIWLGWFWRPLRHLMLVVAALSLLAINDRPARADGTSTVTDTAPSYEPGCINAVCPR